MKQIKYRINRLAPRVFSVEVVWGLLDIMKLYAGRTWPTMGAARKAALTHAEEVCVKPIIVRGGTK